MVKCSFSGKEIPRGKGIMYVRNDGKILYFIDRKSEKNMLKLGRKPQKVAWTAEAKKVKKERMAAEAHAKTESKKE
jgi:large subunit ribosomal protein L24e